MADEDYWRGQVDTKLDTLIDQIALLRESKESAHEVLHTRIDITDKKVDKLESLKDRSIGIAIGIALGGGAIGGGAGAVVSSMLIP